VKITTRSKNHVAIIDLDGDLMPGFGPEDLTGTVSELLREGSRNFLLNLTQVGQIDSSGIGALVRAFTRIRKQGGNLKLLKPSAVLQRVFKLTRLSTVFDIFEDETEAISSF